MKKLLAVGVIVLFLGLAIAPSTGIGVFNDDTTPPVTTCTLDPDTPDGDNGWYVSDVEVTLNATDDMSGVDRIECKIHSGSWQTIPGDNGTFIVDVDHDDLLIEYYAVDNAGNEEDINSFTIDMDQTPPDVLDITWQSFKDGDTWYIRIIAYCSDTTSGMNQVEFYLNDVLIETIVGSFPEYEVIIEFKIESFSVHGLICNRKIIEDNISFFALVVWTDVSFNFNSWEGPVTVYAYDDAGNWDFDDLPIHSPPGPLLKFFKHFNFQNDYTGYIGRFFINAIFEKGPLETTLPCEIE